LAAPPSAHNQLLDILGAGETRLCRLRILYASDAVELQTRLHDEVTRCANGRSWRLVDPDGATIAAGGGGSLPPVPISLSMATGLRTAAASGAAGLPVELQHLERRVDDGVSRLCMRLVFTTKAPRSESGAASERPPRRPRTDGEPMRKHNPVTAHVVKHGFDLNGLPWVRVCVRQPHCA
jgi:hypothetical protein